MPWGPASNSLKPWKTTRIFDWPGWRAKTQWCLACRDMREWVV